MNTDILHEKVLVALKALNIQFEVLDCKPELADTAAFCEHYGYTLEQAANTILVASKKVDPTKYVVCVVLGTTKLDVNKAVCKLMGVKRASFASAEETMQQTAMMIGGVTAFGIENLPIYVDQAVMQQEKVVMGSGNRSSKLLLDPKELQKLPNVQVVSDLAKLKE
jgi:prolyl-tRNA editing enzyme YbaK/EbsC (Cys-tRNA(Pro) deacylase)